MVEDMVEEESGGVMAENGAEENVENGELVEAESRRENNSLFSTLPLDSLLNVLAYIGAQDKTSIMRLAISGDRQLSHFIYTERKHRIWENLDLATCRGITDEQLRSLLERINAQACMKSLLLDKETTSPITGTGLEPLRGSRVLQRVDLRQVHLHSLVSAL